MVTQPLGKLVFLSKCVRQSRVFIARILRLLRSVKFNHHHINLNSEFRKDIQWWCRFLRVYNGMYMITANNWSSPGEVFTTDACLTGCGGLCARSYSSSVNQSSPSVNHEQFPMQMTHKHNK